MAVVLYPCTARAHGDQVLALILYLPCAAVSISLTIATLRWNQTAATKSWVLLVVLGVTGALFLFNHAYQNGWIDVRLEALAYLSVLVAQVVVPVIVWWMCRLVVNAR